MIRTTIAMALLLGLFIHDSQAQSVDCWLTTPDRSALLTHQSPPLVFAPVDAGNTSDSTTIRIDAGRTYQTIDGFGFALTGGSVVAIRTG